MELALIILVAFLLFATALVFFHLRASKKPGDAEEQKAHLLFQQLNDLKNSLQESLSSQERAILAKFSEQDKAMHSQTRSLNENQQKILGDSAKLIEAVTRKLTELESTNKRVVGFAEQMQSLENILRNPKHRGVFGEFFLETLLSSILPPNIYKMQYKFQNGDLVDAVIFMREKIIPIDSKFSLEKYQQVMEEIDAEKRERLEREFKSDVKKRIDETAKYIRPEENTTDFAFMYVPAEGIYHGLLAGTVGISINAKSLMEYAFSKRVSIVSPSSFVAYLQTVLQGLNQLKMEQGFQDIQKNVILLGKHILAFDDRMKKMGTHLGTTVSLYNQSYQEFKKIDKDVYRISEKSAGGRIEVLELEKPQSVE